MNTFNRHRSDAQKLLDLRIFYPQNCFFHWDGKGQVPLASKTLFETHASIEEVCRGCRETDCKVRQAPYEPKT